jgi:prolipoprotein diacylglyceryltransferase
MVLRFRLKAGYAFASLLVLHSLMRFGVSYLRVDSAFVIKDWITVPQFVSILGLGLGLLMTVVVRVRPASWPEQPDPVLPAVPAGQSRPKPA